MTTRNPHVLPVPSSIYRLIWSITWGLLCRWLPRSIGTPWKIFILRLFGAKIESGARVYSSAKIYCPYNLIMKKGSCIDMNVNIYNVTTVTLEQNATVSQGAAIFPGSHDISNPQKPMIGIPITIGANAWIASMAFVGMGVTVGEGAVVGARAAVFKDVEPWTVVGGNPAKFIKKRVINDA